VKFISTRQKGDDVDKLHIETLFTMSAIIFPIIVEIVDYSGNPSCKSCTLDWLLHFPFK